MPARDRPQPRPHRKGKKRGRRQPETLQYDADRPVFYTRLADGRAGEEGSAIGGDSGAIWSVEKGKVAFPPAEVHAAGETASE
jgi:hypothetical protein